MVVPVALVCGVAVTVMDVVHVVTVGNGHVSTTLAVGVIVSGVLSMDVGAALIEVPVVGGVQMSVVDVVHVVIVRDSDVSTAVTMDVGVASVLEMGGGHRMSSCACRMASLTM